MIGFFVSNIDHGYTIPKEEGFIYEKMEIDGFNVQRCTLDKFMDDKLFLHKDGYCVVIEGVALKKQHLIKKNNAKDFYEAVIIEYKKNGNLSALLYPGCNVSLYDTRNHAWRFWTNQIGDKPIFYYIDELSNIWCVSSSVYYIKKFLDYEMISYAIEKTVVEDLLSYGYSISNEGRNTLIRGIRRLSCGGALEINEDCQWRINQWYRFRILPKQKNFDVNKAIEGIDKRFRAAVTLAFEKNREYGYKNLCALSAGLDSRMTFWVGKALGYQDIFLETFSQTNNYDQTVPQKISSDFNLPWIFKSLNAGEFVENIPECVKYVEGLLDGAGIIHGYSLLRLLNNRDFGILHTGQLGDVILGGSYMKDHPKITSGANSQFYFDLYTPDINTDAYDSMEHFYLYTRGFLCTMMAQLANSYQVESISPFTDPDFMSFCFSLPLEMRRDHRIYKEWILKKYPGAAEYIWFGYGLRITAGKRRQELQRYIELFKGRSLPDIVRGSLRALGFRKIKPPAPTSRNMNPWEHWYESSLQVRNVLQHMYERLDNLRIDAGIKKKIEFVFLGGGCYEKIQAVSVICALENFFDL